MPDNDEFLKKLRHLAGQFGVFVEKCGRSVLAWVSKARPGPAGELWARGV